MMPTVASPSDKLLQVRDICVTDYVDAMYSRFRSYIIPSITKSDASELISQKQPFFQWFNCINQYECDTVAGIANIYLLILLHRTSMDLSVHSRMQTNTIKRQVEWHQSWSIIIHKYFLILSILS